MTGRHGVRRQERRGGWRPWLALAFCWLLVVQAMLSGLTVAGHAAAGESGSLAGVICTPDGLRQVGDPAGAPADTRDMNCCLIGCSGTGPTLLPPLAVSVRPAALSSVARVAVPAGRPAAAPRFSPRSTRAPPAAV